MKNFSLNRNERVKKKNNFDKVYNFGKTLFSSDKIIKSIYVIDLDKNFVGIKIAVAVSKKAGNAVWRNRVKRLIKEAYRLNKHALLKKIEKENFGLMIVFGSNSLSEKHNKKITLKDILNPVIELIAKIEKQI